MDFQLELKKADFIASDPKKVLVAAYDYAKNVQINTYSNTTNTPQLRIRTIFSRKDHFLVGTISSQ